MSKPFFPQGQYKIRLQAIFGPWAMVCQPGWEKVTVKGVRKKPGTHCEFKLNPVANRELLEVFSAGTMHKWPAGPPKRVSYKT